MKPNKTNQRNSRKRETRFLKVTKSDSILDNKFVQAIDLYSEAIFCKISPEKKSILYCNRALANLKLENNAIALLDGCEAIKLDPLNVKGYYRRGQAYAALR
jgi:tetratricopeptide (TPR) repeat protein